MRPLETVVGAELAARLLSAPEQLQRDVAIAAAVASMRAARLSRPLLDEAIDDLVRRRYAGAWRDRVEALELELDERAWTIQSEREDPGGDATEYESACRRARAAGAVKMALDTNPRTAVAEAVYEGAHAVDSRERFAQLLDAVLVLVEPGHHAAARDLAGLFWPRFMEVDGYVLVADHFEPDAFAEYRERRPDEPFGRRGPDQPRPRARDRRASCGEARGGRARHAVTSRRRGATRWTRPFPGT